MNLDCFILEYFGDDSEYNTLKEVDVMEFILVLLVFPILSLIFGIVGEIFIKKVYVVGGITFLVWVIATVTIFNSTFIMWVFINTLLALLGACIVEFFRKRKVSREES